MSSKLEDAIAHVRAALAEDESTHALDVIVRVIADAIVLSGHVTTEERRADLERVASEAAPEGLRVVNRTHVVHYPATVRPIPTGALRIAAVGDVHVGADMVGQFRSQLRKIADHADVLLLAGDLTQHGSYEEGIVLAGELEGTAVPVVAVLGNHDYHGDHQVEIRAALERAGVIVLEGEHTTMTLRGHTLGVAGVKGFGSGFAGGCATEFGEPEMKDFVRHTKAQAHVLERELGKLDTDVRIALMHYSPVPDTLEGEPRDIFPFLGSFLLAEAVDKWPCDLALHGHAHRGREMGMTPGGVPVRNVAREVIGEAYRVYAVESRCRVAVQPAFR